MNTNSKLLQFAAAGGTDAEVVILKRLLTLEEEIESKLSEVREAVATVKKQIGPKGDNGEQGERGEKGERGEDGFDGIDGKDGSNGKDGLNGKDGRDGVNGRDGLDGKDGKDGLNGKDGKDGKDVDPEEIKTIKSELENLKTAPRSGGGLNQMALQHSLGKLLRHQSFSTSSATTTLTLNNKVAGDVCIWLRYNGGGLTHGTHYTISGTTITFTFTLDDDSTVETSYFIG